MTANVRRDGNKVWIEGVPHGGPGNSYARGLEVLLRHAGTPVDYDTVMGGTGQAFILQSEEGSPIIDGAVDVGWWPLASWGVTMRLDFLGRAVGRGFRLLGCDAESYRKDPAAHYRERYEAEVKASIAAGKPLLAKQNLCFVVVGYDDGNPPLLGDCSVRDTEMLRRIDESPWGLIVMDDQTERMDRRQADLAALRHAVALGHDTVPVKGQFTGQKSFTLWTAALRDTEHLGQARWHANMVLHLGINRRSAVGYLRAMAKRHGEPVAEHLNAAADLYEKALAELGKANTSEGAMQAREGRERLAELVESIAGLEQQAISGIERAVALIQEALMKANVKREGDKVWIAGVKGFSPAEYADSVHGAQARILQTLGESLSYDDLSCYSGFAFRIGAHDTMCPSAGHPCCGYECLNNGLRALPWKTKIYEAFPGKDPEPNRTAFEAEVCAAIKQSIDRGIPVHYGSEEDGIIIGYADEGRRWWCYHPYHKWGAEPFWYDQVKGFAGGKWPWGVVVWLEPQPADQRVPERDLTIAALKQAVDMWKTEKREKDYYCGEAAYAHWLGWLRGVESGKVEKPKDGMQGNGWYYDVLVHSRAIAGRWLKHRAESFDGEARQRLLAAADHYRQVADLCMKGLEEPWQLALPPNKHGQWTPEMRRTQVQRLEAAREHDRAAIAAIEHALAGGSLEAAAAPAELPAGKVLSGLDGKPAWVTHLGCLMGCLEYVKLPASPAWVSGATGHAFYLNVHETLCPSGPTAFRPHHLLELAANLGADVELVYAEANAPDLPTQRKIAWQKLRAGIAAGHPAYGWCLAYSEWFTIQGYDGESIVYEQTKNLPWQRLAEDSALAVCVVRPGKKAPDRQTIREALRHAVDFANSPGEAPVYRRGLAGYDTWIAALEKGDTLGGTSAFGHAYNAVCWAECRRHAVAFLEEGRKRLNDESLNHRFDEAIAQYKIIADRLGEVSKLFPFDPDHDEAMTQRLKDADRRVQAIAALRAARAAEAEALKALAEIAHALGGGGQGASPQ